MIKNWPDIPFLNKTRLFFGRYILEREWRTSTRDIRSVSLADAKNVGLIFNAKDEKQFTQIKAFVQEMKKEGKMVKALGYVPKPDMMSFFESSIQYEFFSNEDFNWYFKPRGRKVVGFMSERFDLLIDLRLRKSIPLLFIVSLSRATFKVGRYHKQFKEYYDLMMEVDETEPLEFFIKQIKHYLNMMNQPK